MEQQSLTPGLVPADETERDVAQAASSFNPFCGLDGQSSHSDCKLQALLQTRNQTLPQASPAIARISSNQL
jgi:hypothetical protein